MRVLESFDKPVRSVALSPDGRFIAATTESELVVISSANGEKAFVILRQNAGIPFNRDGIQLAFCSKSDSLLFTSYPGMFRVSTTLPEIMIEAKLLADGLFAGGIAVSPDGKTLVASRSGQQKAVMLERWSIPDWRRLIGFDYWSPFRRLAFSANGEFLAGIGSHSFELRIAVTGGLNGRQLRREPSKTNYLTFPRHGETVVFGWGDEIYVMETRAGNVLKRISLAGKTITDAAFVSGGSHLATIDGSDVMRFRSAESWEVVREYDWGVGGLTCIAVAVDGLTGICGTTDGRLIAFDVDE